MRVEIEIDDDDICICYGLKKQTCNELELEVLESNKLGIFEFGCLGKMVTHFSFHFPIVYAKMSVSTQSHNFLHGKMK